MNRRTARRAPTSPPPPTPPAAPVYLGYEALVRHHQLPVPPLRAVSVAVDRTVERHIIAADGQERVELPLRRVADTQSLAARLTFALKREPLNLGVLAALFAQPGVLQDLQAWRGRRRNTPASPGTWPSGSRTIGSTTACRPARRACRCSTPSTT